MLIVAACLAAGIALARAEKATLDGALASVPVLLVLAGAAMLAGLMLLRREWKLRAGVAALAGFVLAGAAAAQLFEFRFSSRHVSHLESWDIDLNDPVRLSGRVAAPPVRAAGRVQFDLEVQNLDDRGRVEPWQGKVRLNVRGLEDAESAAYLESLRLKSGDTVRLLARLRRPLVYRNPGSFDYRRWMKSIEDAAWVGTVRNPLLIEKLPARGASALATLPGRVRARLLEGIDRLYPSWSVRGRDGAVLKAVLLGDRSALDSETIENFRQSGLYHLLVISGLHVGLLALLLALVLRRLPLGETARAALLVALLFGYLSLVELRAPTLRATLMISLYLLARFFYRRHALLNAVGLAALLLLLARPPWLFESGFQLSFAAALLIAGLAVPILERTTEPYRRALHALEEVGLDESFEPRHAQFRLEVRRLAEWFERRAALLRSRPRAARAAVTFPLRALAWTANILLFTAILQVGLILPMAETFHRVTFAGIGLNALAIPLMTVLLALAVPTVGLAAVAPALAAWPAKLLGVVMSGMFALTDLPHLPAWLSYRVPAPPEWVAWGFAASVVAAAAAWTAQRKIFWASVAALGAFAALVSLHPFAPQLPRGKLQMTALDCGRGAAVFVVLPEGSTLLVDACGAPGRTSEDPAQARRWDPGESLVSPYLWSRGVKRIDYLVASDPRGGRLAGLEAVSRNFRIGEFWMIRGAGSPASARLMEALEARGIHIYTLAAGDVLRAGQSTVRVLWPPRELSRGGRDEVLVARVSVGAASVVLAGGLSRQVQRILMAAPGFEPAGALALSGPAPASALSAEFLARLRPRVLLVSGGDATGRASAPRPAGETEIFETARLGAITAEMETPGLSLRSYPAGAEGAAAAASTGGVSGSSRRLP